MEKLVCNFSECETLRSSIKNLIEEYNSLLQAILSLESHVETLWVSESQRAYYNAFLGKKNNLEKLKLYYEELEKFLDETFSTYKKIENKYL